MRAPPRTLRSSRAPALCSGSVHLSDPSGSILLEGLRSRSPVCSAGGPLAGVPRPGFLGTAGFLSPHAFSESPGCGPTVCRACVFIPHLPLPGDALTQRKAMLRDGNTPGHDPGDGGISAHGSHRTGSRCGPPPAAASPGISLEMQTIAPTPRPSPLTHTLNREL